MSIPYNPELESLIDDLMSHTIFYAAQPFVGSLMARKNCISNAIGLFFEGVYISYFIDKIYNDPAVLEKPEFYASIGAVALLQTAGFLYRKYKDRPVKVKDQLENMFDVMQD